MAKKQKTDNLPAAPDFDTREVLDLLDKELVNAKECVPFDDDAIRAYGLKMFTHGYNRACQNARLIFSKSGGNS
jgi:hypothetical protein